MSLKERLRLLRMRCMGGSFDNVDRRFEALERRLRDMHEAIGRMEARQTAHLPADSPLHAREFRVYSQWGEDGIIQHLVNQLEPLPHRFVEFGVEAYHEANTRFLLSNNHWSGLVLDGDREMIARLHKDRVYWLNDLTAVHAFITRDNINDLLRDHGFAGELGLLSIDIDGVDWWVWEAIHVADPTIVVIEYNHRFGPERSVTVPYRPDFDRRQAHHSIVYYGASLEALRRLGARKGYDLVGCCSAGLNAFFVRSQDRPDTLAALDTQAAFVPGRFSEYHDPAGNRVKTDAQREAEIACSLPLVTVNADGFATDA